MKVRNLKKSYGQGSEKVEILKGLNFDIQEGETVALIGKSGSGKSTLLSLLSGLDRPDSGEVFLNEKNIFEMSDRELAIFRSQNIGIVFQQFHLVSTLTALENIILPLELSGVAEPYERAQELIDAVGLSHRAHHLPSQLSGGECQRVAIARALSIKPRILFADEPSGNLDEETGEMVMNLLFEMVKDTRTTLVLVTHDLELAQKCSRIIHLEHGSIG
ncbi:MAG: ABC transporter ATP-binding protein [Candidatus Caldatribacteriota bacterium]